ncbi:MAG TPA: hypothetical protein VF805_05090 [Anaeromyxobacteraceae bacterium]
MGKRSGKAVKATVSAVAQPARTVPAAAANAPAAAAPSFPAVEAPSRVAASWNPSGNGSGELLVAYEGPLAAKAAEPVLARTGTLREGGQPWAETHDVRLTRQAPGRYVGVIAVPTGAPVEAIELAFHAGDAWDNGGRAPLGFYEWSAKDQRLEAR